jgi:CheY-like chemotaxis protein
MTPDGHNEDCILVAEDEETDVFILRTAFERAGLTSHLEVVRDGFEAVAYLKGDGKYSDRVKFPVPRLLVLDLKMPIMNGFDVLAWLSERPEFKDLPRVILSASSHESDIRRARQMGALDYHIKPSSLSRLIEMLQEMHARWIAAPPHTADSLLKTV